VNGNSGNLYIVGLGAADGHIELITWQDVAAGNWHAGTDLSGALPGAPVISASPETVESGSAFTISWTVPSGSINHYTLSKVVNSGTATLSACPSSTTAVAFSVSTRLGTDKFIDYSVRACTTADDSVCTAWSNTVEVDVYAPCGRPCQ
jgi:hypothetical protein